MLYMLLCCFLMLNSTFVMFRAMSAISKGSAKENRSEISLIVLATLGIASPFIVAMITINESMTSKTVTDFSLGAQWSGMVSAVALMGYMLDAFGKRRSPYLLALSWPLP